MAELAAAGAALANGAGSLFSYNKDVFVFDNTLRQQKVHQIQNIRLQQVGLYREDLRDLFGLTISKMDNYLVVNTLMLGFCIALFYDGVLPDNNPPWIWWMWLPLPRTEDIAAASATVEDYECCPVSSILRIPGLQRFDPRRKKADMDAFSKVDKDGRVSGEGDRMYHIHFKLFEHVQKSWQGYDAYARVCMAVGTNQLLLTLCVFAMGINLTLSKLELIVMVALIYAAPLTAAVAATLDYAGWLVAGRVWALISFIINDLWICFVFAQAMESRGGLPEKFNTVDISSDVMSDNSMQHFVQDELRDLGIDAENPGDFLWGSSDLTKGSTPDGELLGKCEEEESKLAKVFADDSKLPRMPNGRLAALKSDFQKIRNEFDLAKRTEQSSNDDDVCDDTSSMETSSEQDWVKLAGDCSANGPEGSRTDYYVNSVTGDIRWRPALRRSMSDTLSSASTRGLSSESSAGETDRLEHEVREFKKSVEKLEMGSIEPEDRYNMEGDVSDDLNNGAYVDRL
ncbi:pumilio domain member 4 [Perkinsus chesapeaki]|uniref:Pumilio domain member 4 n=1 Tax=Perkinsus chesapeaki TaxID=330153 RepID=A0A7J6MAA4_PERCH|nr:pumilio domain member 4 [Perkinsus chesapeaki]